MFPVLFSIGKISISSFGVFLAAGFLLGLFLIWRLSRAWDLDEEKILDLAILTLLGALAGARIIFCIEHWQFFLSNPLYSLLFYRAPGFSFWGGFLVGSLTLYFFAKRKRVDFWMISDIASIGLLGGLILADLGCFFGGCAIGIQNNLFLSVNMVGAIGKRFPVQVLEAIILTIALSKLWGKSIHFHTRGKILSLSLIYIGLIKLLLEPLKDLHSDLFLSAILTILGINIFYRVTKRSLKADLKSLALFLYKLLTSSLTRKTSMDRLKKYWYNQKTSVSWKWRNFRKTLRRLNVRFSYQNERIH